MPEAHTRIFWDEPAFQELQSGLVFYPHTRGQAPYVRILADSDASLDNDVEHGQDGRDDEIDIIDNTAVALPQQPFTYQPLALATTSAAPPELSQMWTLYINQSNTMQTT